MRVAAALACALTIGSLGCALREPARSDVHPIYIRSVKLDPITATPVVLLAERGGVQRELPIWVGVPQAESIALGLEDVAPPRPNTHDLLIHLVEQLGGRVLRVVVTELRDSTYYAVVEIQVNGRVVALDARPSDAIALAVRSKVDMFATDAVLDEGAPAGEEEQTLEVRSHGARLRENFVRVRETHSLPEI